MADTRPRDQQGRIIGAHRRRYGTAPSGIHAGRVARAEAVTQQQREYEQREMMAFYNQTRDVERAPLADRKEAAASFLEAMRDDPALVGERVGWLIGGNYGKGGQLKAQQVLGMSKRANKVAMLTHMVAAAEWRCPAAMVVAGWKKLTAAQKKKLDAAVNRAIKEEA